LALQTCVARKATKYSTFGLNGQMLRFFQPRNARFHRAESSRQTRSQRYTGQKVIVGTILLANWASSTQ